MSVWNSKADLAENIISLNREMGRISAGLERNNELLHEHMRRTELLEEQMDTALLPIRVGRVAAVVIGVLATVLTAWATWRGLLH